MKRVLLATAAVLALSAPAFAQQDVQIEKRTITREAAPVPEDRTTIEKRSITREEPAPSAVERRTITREEPAESRTEKRTITREERGSGSTVSTTVIAPREPPALQVETPPPPPRPGAVWVGGHWRWEPGAANFVWVHGHFAEPPRPRAAWMPGRWVPTAGGWVFEEGRGE
jgi:YXWGXW repeat-containing protein